MSDIDGLSATEAAQRLTEDGPNALPGGQRRSLLTIAWETARQPMFLLLLTAGTLYLIFGELQEGLILFGFVLVTLGLTLYQEGKTERAIEALRDLTSPRALVLRDGTAQRIAGREVVRDDLIMLAEGDRVPADALLIAGSGLQVDESLLTGEAVPVTKVVAAGEPPAARPGGDDTPFVYSGTLVVSGQGTARVTATGPRSEIGRIGTALGTLKSERSPLQKQTARLITTLALLALGMSLVLILVHGLLSGNWLQAVLAGIALAMAMLPEEYPVVLTVFPALGAWRLSKEKVLTRRMAAIETLGATSVLCVDKTGTLTENRMTVARLLVGADTFTVDETATDALPEVFHPLVEFSILASAIDPFDPMEQAFQRLGQRFLAKTEHLHRDWTLVQEYGLTPELRAMSQVWKAVEGSDHVVAAKGAPEAIIDLCHLDAPAQARIAAAVETLAGEGLRVLAVAQARFAGDDWPAIEHEFDFTFIGLLGLSDPLRVEIPGAVAQCREAGIRVVMITGDYPTTARTIARQAGLAADDILSGDDLTALSDVQLQARMKTVSVCARIAPEQKLRIVQALKADGEITAMTGDGVNDAPALKAAHVGIAMGGRGTDVAREAASLVLLDDNFASIVRAVRLGRRIFANMRKSMSYILAVHVPIAGMALFPVLMGYPAMLFPMHIAFLELIIDPACSLAFENEPEEPDSMQRPPRDPDAPLFGGATLWRALVQGIGVLLIVMGAYAWAHHQLSEPAARAFAFTTLVIANLALIFSNRSRSGTPLAALFAPNLTLWIVTGLTLVVLAVSLYLPGLAGLFRFAPLPASELAVAVGLGLASVVWFQLLRLRNAKRRLVWGALGLAGATAAIVSLGLTGWLNLSPCDLCIVQRLLFMLIAILALLAALPIGPQGRALPGGLVLGLAALGVSVAALQSWLQLQPPITGACVGGQLGIAPMVEWLGQQAPSLFLSSGVCAEQGLMILGFSLANWTLMIFAAVLVVGAWALVHEARADRPRTIRSHERRSHERRAMP
ncbi:HAD-IC family P-type ATPase [Allochromatium palmeri]|uniref:P-type Cu(+) transporter n=1 Tax=Allochromatium palmeri TaxID=231048 RepID=A0A6N8EGT7_9GAMM|nr:HAD-IC family P-type ATPase [Allochromatium palmeri]MTW22790.1 HAD-IC family P-type ATPase [Allochromatium palmeri]